VLAHIGWPAVALAVVYLIGRAVKEKETWWRLVFGIVVLVVVAMGIVVACVRVLGVQVPGFHLPATSRTPVPTASAGPQHEVPATAAPEAVPIPTAASGSPCGRCRGEDPGGALHAGDRHPSKTSASASSSSSVRADPQPCAGAPASAYASVTRPATASAAPGRSSSRAKPRRGWSRGTRCGPSRPAATPTGTFTKNTDRQPSQVVSTPPASTPRPRRPRRVSPTCRARWPAAHPRRRW
jgi:hypothetical protein